MWVTNDVSLITLVPFAILILNKIERKDLLIPVIVMQTVTTNLGSMCTPIGIPQNFICILFPACPLWISFLCFQRELLWKADYMLLPFIVFFIFAGNMEKSPPC